MSGKNQADQLLLWSLGGRQHPVEFHPTNLKTLFFLQPEYHLHSNYKVSLFPQILDVKLGNNVEIRKYLKVELTGYSNILVVMNNT